MMHFYKPAMMNETTNKLRHLCTTHSLHVHVISNGCNKLLISFDDCVNMKKKAKLGNTNQHYEASK